MRGWLLLGLLVTLVSALHADAIERKVTVDGVVRTALVYPGKRAATTPAPLVFAFHGFSGHAADIAGWSHLHVSWPEATVVYPQGLPTWSRRLKRMVPAWQAAPGRDDDRDLRYMDALIADLSTAYKVDPHRIYAAGISNGALFCYVLLTKRPQVFAAFAPVAGACGFVQDATVPRPVLMVQGKRDSVVKLAQAEATRDLLLALNGCGLDTVEWAPGYRSYQPCASGQPIIWYTHNGGHIWPEGITTAIVKFFGAYRLEDAH